MDSFSRMKWLNLLKDKPVKLLDTSDQSVRTLFPSLFQWTLIVKVSAACVTLLLSNFVVL